MLTLGNFFLGAVKTLDAKIDNSADILLIAKNSNRPASWLTYFMDQDIRYKGIDARPHV